VHISGAFCRQDFLDTLYFHSLSQVTDSTAKTLSQLFEREIEALRNRNIYAVAATADNASNLIKTCRGNLTPDYSFPRQACSAHTVQFAVFDNFGGGKPNADETAKIRHVCEVASANRKAFPFLCLPHAPR
jgi:hypothetical protein